MTSRAELRGFVTLDSRRFQAGMRRMRRSIRRWNQRMQRMGQIARRAFLVITAAVVAATAVIYRMVRATSNAGDAINKMALRTGLGEEALSELGFVAEITGTNLESMQKAVKSLAKFVSYARDGLATYTRELDKMGIAVSDLEGLTPTQAFGLFIDKLSEMDDELQRSATAQVVFGRAGLQLMPMIKAGGREFKNMSQRARELGIVFDKDGADASARFKDRVTELKFSLQGVRNQAVLGFIDEFSDGINRITDNIIDMRKRGDFVTWAASSAMAAVDSAAEIQKAFIQMKHIVAGVWEPIALAAKIALESISIQMDKLFGKLGEKGPGKNKLKDFFTRFYHEQKIASAEAARLTATGLEKEILDRQIARYRKERLDFDSAAAREMSGSVEATLKRVEALKDLRAEYMKMEKLEQAGVKTTEAHERIEKRREAVQKRMQRWIESTIDREADLIWNRERADEPIGDGDAGPGGARQFGGILGIPKSLMGQPSPVARSMEGRNEERRLAVQQLEAQRKTATSTDNISKYFQRQQPRMAW